MTTPMTLTAATITLPDGTVLPRVRVQIRNAELKYTPPGQSRVVVPRVISNALDPKNQLRHIVTVEGDDNTGPATYIIEQDGSCCA